MAKAEFLCSFMIASILAVTACGGAARRQKQEMALLANSLPDIKPVSIFDERTLWPRTTEIIPEETGASAGDSGESPTLFEFRARLLRGQVSVEETSITETGAGKLLGLDSDAPTASSSEVGVGTVTLPRGIPVEFGFWMALVDRIRSIDLETRENAEAAGFGKFLHVAQGDHRVVTRPSDQRKVILARDLVEFMAAPGVLCSAQIRTARLYDDRASSGDIASDQAVQAGQVSGTDYDRAEAMGVLDREAGQLVARMSGPDASGQYELRLHFSADAENCFGDAETLDQVLRCRAPQPLFAVDIPGFALTAVPGCQNNIVVRLTH